MLNHTRSVAAVGLVGVLVVGGAAGCTKKKTGIAVEQNPQPKLEQNVTLRINDLRDLIGRFEQDTRGLPGRDETEHRKIMGKAFSDLAEILPIIAGPTPSGSFRLQLRQVESAREHLNRGNPNLAVEPIEDAGLRAAAAALQSVAHDAFYNRSEIGDALDRLRTRVQQLDREHGPGHRLVVRDVTRGMVDVLRMMGDTYAERTMPPETTQPTTGATTQP
jgi:hypothetical protein